MSEMQYIGADVETAQELARLLGSLGEAVRSHLLVGRDVNADREVVGNQGGDTIFAIDRRVEPVLQSLIESWPDRLKSILLIAEGFGATGHQRFGDPDEKVRFRLIIDPIDGHARTDV